MGLRPQAHEIIRTWTFVTIVKSHLHHGAAPWKDIAVSGYITVPRPPEEKKSGKAAKSFKAEKISKSRHGQQYSPLTLLDEYGTDAVRYWAASAALGADMPINMKDFEAGRRTLVKLWNAFRFAEPHLAGYAPPAAAPELEAMDAWLLVRLNAAIRQATAAFEAYDFRGARGAAGEFLWADFCDNFLEIVKDRLYHPAERGEAAAASGRYALYRAALGLLGLFAPFTPHVAEELYQALFRGTVGADSVHRLGWPEPLRLDLDEGLALRRGAAFLGVLGAVRKYRGDRGLSPKAGLAEVTVACHPEEAALFTAGRRDLAAVANVGRVEILAAESRGSARVEIPGTDFEAVSFAV